MLRRVSLPALLLSLCLACVAYTPPDAGPGQQATPQATRPLVAPPLRTTPPFPPQASPAVPRSCLVARPARGNATAPELPGSRIEPVAAVAPAPLYQPLPLEEDRALQRRLLEVLGPESASYAYFVKDLRSGRGAAFNAEKVFYSASLFKLFVMYEVFHQVEAGVIDPRESLVLTPYYDAFGLTPRVTRLCQELTVEEALQAMMQTSDNAAAVLLQDLAGSANINQALAALGLRSSRLLPEGLPVTAADVALLLEAIGRERAISPDASRAMIELMAGETLDNGLKAGLPPDARLAHKTGIWNNASHDAGIVFTEFNTYVIVVLSEKSGATQVTRNLSRAAYEYFRDLYRRR